MTQGNWCRTFELFATHSLLTYRCRRYPLGTPIANITDLGTGTLMYLQMVQRFIIYFFLASVICLPSLTIILLSASKQIGSIQNSPLEPLKVFRCEVATHLTFSRFSPPRSIASLFSGNFTVTDEVSSANVGCTHQHCVLCSPSTCYKLDSNTVAVVIANLDLLNCVLFFLLSVYFSRWIDRRNKEVNDATLTPSDFTLNVYNLANDTTIDDVREVFNSNYKLPDGSPSCALVRIAYDESNFLSAFMKQSKLSESFENAEAACCRSDSAKNRNALAKCRALMSKNSVCDHSPIPVQFKLSKP